MSVYVESEKKFVEFEIQLRVNDEKIKLLNEKLISIDKKLNLLLGIIFSSVIAPIILHMLNIS